MRLSHQTICLVLVMVIVAAMLSGCGNHIEIKTRRSVGEYFIS